MMQRTEKEITISGNPRKPVGEDGEKMLQRMNRSHASVTQWALEHWEIEEDDQVLDIGCGGGATLKRMSEKIGSGQLTGVDYSSVSIKTSEETNQEEIAAGKIHLIEASVEKLPFAADSFDKIITVESFYFWPNPKENLKEVLRVLKPGGTFLLVADTYNKEGLDQEVLKNIYQFHMFTPTEKEFYELMEQAGFREIQIHLQEGTDWICVEGKK